MMFLAITAAAISGSLILQFAINLISAKIAAVFLLSMGILLLFDISHKLTQILKQLKE